MIFGRVFLKEFNKANPDCLTVYLNLRETFFDYNKLVKSICDKEKDKDIIKDIKNYGEIDEFAYLLNENIKNYLKEKKVN